MLASVIGMTVTIIPLTAHSGEKHSGFLPDYSRLGDDPYHEDAKIWVNPTLKTRGYDAVFVDPVTLHLNPDLIKDGVKPDAEVMNKVFDYFHQALVREFGSVLTVADKSGDGVLRYRAAITAVKPEVEGAKNPLNYIPVMFVARAATGKMQAKAYIAMESYYTDSLTNEAMGEVMQSGHGGKADHEEITLDSLKPVLDRWAKKAAQSLKRELGGS
jgi:hypothetical protein